MKQIFILVTTMALGLALGIAIAPQFSGTNSAPETSEASDSGEKKPLYWVAPMDKNYRRDGPGKSPMGMDLIPVYEEEGGSENGVKISAVVENNLGVRTASVSKNTLIMPVKTIGTVQFDESTISHIHPRVEGWIEKLSIKASGDQVKKGQVLFELYSPELVNAQEEYLAALRSQSNSLRNAARSKLKSLGLTEAHLDELDNRRKVERLVKFTSDHTGIVIDLKVREGMYIKPMTDVMSLGALSTVWILGEVFERQAYMVKKDQTVEISLNSFPGKVWQGRVNYIYPSLDPKTRTLQFRALVSNPDNILKPNMLANLTVINQSQTKVLSVPRSAVIKGAKHNRVVKSLGEGRFQSVLVEIGSEGDVNAGDDNGIANWQTHIQILKGLTEGDKVVTSAQFLIDSESNIEAELARMEEEANVSSIETAVLVGSVNRVMSDSKKMNVTHQPVTEWGWPSMKMDFEVANEVDINHLKKGDLIRFEVSKISGNYPVTKIISINENVEATQEHTIDHSQHKEHK